MSMAFAPYHRRALDAEPLQGLPGDRQRKGNQQDALGASDSEGDHAGLLAG
jgi:hypothetical protein